MAASARVRRMPVPCVHAIPSTLYIVASVHALVSPVAPLPPCECSACMFAYTWPPSRRNARCRRRASGRSGGDSRASADLRRRRRVPRAPTAARHRAGCRCAAQGWRGRGRRARRRGRDGRGPWPTSTRRARAGRS
eukprot:3935668-Prymnesium_polylepis.1